MGNLGAEKAKNQGLGWKQGCGGGRIGESSRGKMGENGESSRGKMGENGGKWGKMGENGEEMRRKWDEGDRLHHPSFLSFPRFPPFSPISPPFSPIFPHFPPFSPIFPPFSPIFPHFPPFSPIFPCLVNLLDKIHFSETLHPKHEIKGCTSSTFYGGHCKMCCSTWCPLTRFMDLPC